MFILVVVFRYKYFNESNERFLVISNLLKYKQNGTLTAQEVGEVRVKKGLLLFPLKS